jgi:four helix bundle protein
MKDIIIKDKSYKFSVRIVNLYKYLTKKKKEFILAKQILRCGTSIGANIEEATGGISTPDFKHKLSIAYKEARETEYWLKLLRDTDFITNKMFDSLIKDCTEICKILYTILKNINSKT